MVLYRVAVWEAGMARAYGIGLRRRMIEVIDGGTVFGRRGEGDCLASQVVAG